MNLKKFKSPYIANQPILSERSINSKKNYVFNKLKKNINEIIYMNDGDWVESCTALVEHHDGKWEIITWTKENDNVIGK